LNRQILYCLGSLSANICDFFPLISQIQGDEDAYDIIDNFNESNFSINVNILELPGIFFWGNIFENNIYVSLKNYGNEEIRDILRELFYYLREKPNIETIKRFIERKRVRNVKSEEIKKENQIIFNISNSSIGQLGEGSNNLNLVNIKGEKYLDSSTETHKNESLQNKSKIEINTPATVAAFIGFLSTEIGTYFYPITYSHIISIVVAILAFLIVAILSKNFK